MMYQFNKRSFLICLSLIAAFAMMLMMSITVAHGQSADNKAGGSSSSASTTPQAEKTYFDGYKLSLTGEMGWRWKSVDGNERQYLSNLNYKSGFRTFDSNLFMQKEDGKGKYFDSLLISNSGWGSDPTGYTRVNMEKVGFYKLNSTVRRINYYNNLSSFIAVNDPNQHTQNTRNTMGDFDITFLPQNELLKINVGTSFGTYTGPGTWTMRWNSDEFKVDSDTDNRSRDYRIGLEGKLLGFDWNVTEGFRFYKDRTRFAINDLNQGHATTNTTAVSSFSRAFPIDSHLNFTQFNLHRTFADRVDFTGRVIYSGLTTATSLNEFVSGRDASNNFIDSDVYTATGNSKRPQTRADIGVTYRATDSFTVSNTFTFDQFAISTNETFAQDAIRRSPTGAALTPTTSRSFAYRYDAFRRHTNLLEGDYQFTKWLSAHLGWRYTTRQVRTDGFDASVNVTTGITTYTYINKPAGLLVVENTTNTLIGGMKIKPMRRWTIYWDVEHGTADNVFTRLENYEFTNFRIRSKFRANKFSFDLSVITKDNSNPEFAYPAGSTITPSFGFTPITEIKSRFYSGSVTWDPNAKVNVSGGYTYRDQNTFTPVIFPYGVCLTTACTGTGGTATLWNAGYSRFFMHDHYGYIETAFTPVSRLSIYAAFRMNKDTGQDGLVSPLINADLNPRQTAGGLPVFANIIGGYPMTFTTPEVRMAIRLTNNIDWNVGYQYYKYTDVNNPALNYKAQLPFTSLRFYFGGATANRLNQ